MMDVLSRADGKQESGITGVFMDDSDLAVRSAKDGFNCLLGYRASLEEPNQLPRRLRKDYQDEKSCSVVSCSSRR